jgi:hypothetical protein
MLISAEQTIFQGSRHATTCVEVNFSEDTLLSSECGNDGVWLWHTTIHVEQTEQDVVPGSLVFNDVAGQPAAYHKKRWVTSENNKNSFTVVDLGAFATFRKKAIRHVCQFA